MFNKSKKFLILSIIFTILAVGLNIFIIYQSCLSGPKSSDWSKPIAEAAADVVNAVKPETITEVNMPNFTAFIRKAIGHYGLFGLDGILTTLALIFASFETKFYNKYKGIFCSLIFGLIIALLTEVIQLFTPGRSGDLIDSAIDFAGYLTSFIIILFILFIVKKNQLKSNE